MAAETCDDEDVPNLAKEKEMALNIIDKVVGKNRKRSRNAKSKTMDEDEEVRQQNNTSAHVVQPVTPKNDSAADDHDNKNVYYEVAASLKNAFTKSTESTNTASSSHVFKFHTDGDFSEELAVEDEGDDEGHDESHDETVMETMESVPDSAPYDEAFLFFFHSSSRELRNRLDGTQFFSSYSKY